ncbi:hypothetical protein J6590_087336 [Homalodisca vitripennis]|nr:hypothetical protein J6590_087336 [Homalodisca vitripennis]
MSTCRSFNVRDLKPTRIYPSLYCSESLSSTVLVEGKILGSRHRHANDTNLHEKVSLAVFFNHRLGRGLLTCMKKSYENRLRKSVTFTASSRDLKVKPMSYNSVLRCTALTFFVTSVARFFVWVVFGGVVGVFVLGSNAMTIETRHQAALQNIKFFKAPAHSKLNLRDSYVH